jgi:tungstate transport system substrate-binding protein
MFVHAKAEEEKFVADGFGLKRYPVTYNDFVLIGPNSDPAGIKGMATPWRRFKTARTRSRVTRSRANGSSSPIIFCRGSDGCSCDHNN